MKTLFCVLSFVMLINVSNVNAQSIDKLFTINTIKNLSAGINSDNYGLKRSAIYLAGKYRLDQLIDDLIKTLDAEQDEAIKIFAALAIGQIGDKKGVEAVRSKIPTEDNAAVKQVYIAVSFENGLWDLTALSVLA